MVEDMNDVWRVPFGVNEGREGENGRGALPPVFA
jgi:hypothetical protein